MGVSQTSTVDITSSSENPSHPCERCGGPTWNKYQEEWCCEDCWEAAVVEHYAELEKTSDWDMKPRLPGVYDEIIRRLVFKHDIDHVDLAFDKFYMARAHLDESDVTDGCYCCGREIMLGIYKDEQLRFIGFLHEVGHIVSKEPMIDEVDAWKYAFRLVKKLGIELKPSTVDHCRNCLKSYIGGRITQEEFDNSFLGQEL